MSTIDVNKALEEALTPPDHYWGAITDLVTQGWAQVAGRHRDSDLLEISNWETMLTYYNENYEVNEDFRVEGSSHWLVGWNDCLLVRALQCDCEDWEDADFYHEISSERFRCRTCATVGKIRPVFQDALDFQERINDYPVLDEEDWSRREHEEFMDYIEQEVGEEYVEACARYLFDEHSYCNVDDIDWKVLKAWKEENVKNDE